MKKKAVVCHSGGMDSSLCLAQAVEEFGAAAILSVGFTYSQRHLPELERADNICAAWGVDRTVLDINCLQEITHNSLMDKVTPFIVPEEGPPNTMVVGRNGLMARLCAIHAAHIGASIVYMGVMEGEAANSGYRDCSRHYMDLMEGIMRLDLDDPTFEIRTPLVHMTKKQSLDFGHRLGVLAYLLKETITCYEGLGGKGCQKCPACQLRNEGIAQFLEENPEFSF